MKRASVPETSIEASVAELTKSPRVTKRAIAQSNPELKASQNTKAPRPMPDDHQSAAQMTDDGPEAILSELPQHDPCGSRADGKDNKWSYDTVTKMWTAPDGTMIDAPPPKSLRKGGFQKGDRLAKGGRVIYRK